MLETEVVLQIFNDGGYRFGGRIIRAGVEDGRVEDCASVEDVKYIALGAGINFDRVELLDRAPPTI